MRHSDFVFFWGNTTNSEYACFSQLFFRYFCVEGQNYCCMEQYMMAQKALLFNDLETWKKIMSSDQPVKIKKYGREVKNFDSDIWDGRKFDIVVKGNLEKFSQNPDLRKRLLSTGNRIIAEVSQYDSIWGIGISPMDPRLNDPAQWSGQNLLGKALMEVRKILNAK